MPVLLRAEGPSLNRTHLLEDGTAAAIVGRDPAATLHLPDPDRLLSRRHLSIAASGLGVQVTVLSSVNGATTNQGELAPGQTVHIGLGGHVTLGSYTIRIEAAEAGGGFAAVGAPSAADDPFASLFGGAGPTFGRGSDPFDALGVPRAKPPAPAAADPFAAMSQSPAAGPQQARPGLGGELHSFGHNLAQPQTGAQVSADDPMSLLGSVGAGSASRTGGGTMNIDDWLGTGTGSAGTPAPAQGPGRLPTDHVHDLNLPLRLPQGAATPAAQPLVNSIGAPATQPFPTGGGNADPWGALESGWNVAASAGAATAAKAPEPAGKSTYPSPAAPQELDFDALFGGGSSADPFQDSSWFGPGQQSPAPHAADLPARPAVGSAAPSQAAISPAAPRHDADPAAAGLAGGTGHVQAATAFARGLGLAQTPALDDAAWERVGEAVRLIVSGLIDLLNARAELKRELRVEDRTMLASRDNNPLKTGIDLASALQYLLIAQNGMPGFKPADAALREAVDELRVHELATVAASRAAVEAALREFDPETLRKQLSPGKSRLPQFFDSSRMWEAYVERYEKQGAQMADWLEKIFSRHFVPAYSRESERLKMSMTPPAGQGKNR